MGHKFDVYADIFSDEDIYDSLKYEEQNPSENEHKGLIILVGSYLSSVVLGTIVGALFGTFVFPGVGTLMGAGYGACCGSAIASGVTGCQGLWRTTILEKYPNSKETIASGALLMLSLLIIGGIVGTLIAPGIGTLIGFAIALLFDAIVLAPLTYSQCSLLIKEENFRDELFGSTLYKHPWMKACEENLLSDYENQLTENLIFKAEAIDEKAKAIDEVLEKMEEFSDSISVSY